MDSSKSKNYNDIASISIYPSIGMARVGNSITEYFIGPEIPGTIPHDPQNFRDAQGRIKRQAVRFRVFGKDKNDQVICELDASDAEITWNAHLANKKASWYNFDQALDISASNGTFNPGVPAIASIQRNNYFTGSRDELTIDPGARQISGCGTNHDGKDLKYAFDSGKFVGTPVYLGEMRTDENGNLILLGGLGHSASYDHKLPSTFANNEGWHDDVSDGPVNVTVKLKDGGRELSASDAWVVVAPPDYAPGVQAIITGYDLVQQVAIEMEPSLSPEKVIFYEQIYPILRNLTLNQWVNAGFAIDFGWGSDDYTTQAMRDLLGNPDDNAMPYRQAVFEKFRNPSATYLQATSIPEVYGDAVIIGGAVTNPMQWMPVLQTQYDWLKKWAAGDFITGNPGGPRHWDEMTAKERAEGMTRANLEGTIGGPFHPGCEFTWPLRNQIMYSAPFRIKRRNTPEPNYGPQLSPGVALMVNGPLDGSLPGCISRWMACPWQTDTASCLSAYDSFSGEYLPTFWPARVPNDVLTQQDYDVIMSGHGHQGQMEAFSSGKRLKWLRNIIYNDQNPAARLTVNKSIALQHFVDQWYKVGIVIGKPGPGNGMFPEQIFVETGRDVTPILSASVATEESFFEYVKKHYRRY